MSNFLMLKKRKRSDFLKDFKHKNSPTMDSGHHFQFPRKSSSPTRGNSRFKRNIYFRLEKVNDFLELEESRKIVLKALEKGFESGVGGEQLGEGRTLVAWGGVFPPQDARTLYLLC